MWKALFCELLSQPVTNSRNQDHESILSQGQALEQVMIHPGSRRIVSLLVFGAYVLKSIPSGGCLQSSIVPKLVNSTIVNLITEGTKK